MLWCVMGRKLQKDLGGRSAPENRGSGLRLHTLVMGSSMTRAPLSFGISGVLTESVEVGRTKGAAAKLGQGLMDVQRPDLAWALSIPYKAPENSHSHCYVLTGSPLGPPL